MRTHMGAVTLLDGGIGHLLKAKGVERLVPGLEYEQLFLAGALANDLAPEAVSEVHRENIAAGAPPPVAPACVMPPLCQPPAAHARTRNMQERM